MADAGFEVRQVRLYPFPGERSDSGVHAYHFAPGQRIFRCAEFPDDLGGQIEDANRHLDRHRIAVWVDADEPVLAAKLRHELEHVRQYEQFGPKLFDLNDLIGNVMRHKVGGLAGGARLYNFNPFEVDANAAAARFAWKRYGEDEARKRLDDGALFRSHTPPSPTETLPRRLLCFLGQFPDLCDLEAQEQRRPFVDIVETAWPGMGDAWLALTQIEIA